MNSLGAFAKKLIMWNEDTFGNIFKEKRLCTQLEGVQYALSRSNSTDPLKLEDWLKKEQSVTLLQEEMLWR